MKNIRQRAKQPRTNTELLFFPAELAQSSEDKKTSFKKRSCLRSSDDKKTNKSVTEQVSLTCAIHGPWRYGNQVMSTLERNKGDKRTK